MVPRLLRQEGLLSDLHEQIFSYGKDFFFKIFSYGKIWLRITVYLGFGFAFLSRYFGAPGSLPALVFYFFHALDQ